MLSVKNLVKIYKQKGAEPVKALNNVSIDFPETGLVFLLGKSGSGKSTLLNAIGGLDTFDDGEIIIKGKSSKDFSQSDFDSYRNTFIGFIFQEYNILENFSVEKNLAIAIELQHKKPNKKEIHELLEQVDMLEYAKRKPNQLSGGQKQRVAIARALIKHPEIIMADEPTGALDSNTGKQVMETLKKLSKEKLVIIVSHDREFAEIYGDRIVELKDGKIISDVTKKEIKAQETKSGIKIIDNSIVYIKKGQEISEVELKNIARIINEKSKKTDTFITFDEKANKELKKGAKITDEGNRETFVSTEPEDVKTKVYNGASLKLIRSRLKFSDSLKMGASALKNKVGKLVFTILLSFLAFTVFGIIDALSCWNRADSVYQAMTMQEKTHLAAVKYQKEQFGADRQGITVKELEKLQSDFREHVLKGVINADYYIGSFQGTQISLNGYELSDSSNNPLKTTRVSGFIDLNPEELEKLGFSLEGRLPQKNNEIAISKFTFENIVEATKDKTNKITSFDEFNPMIAGSTNLEISLEMPEGYHLSYQKFTIVGIIDDKTDLSEFTKMTEEEISNSDTAEMSIFYGFSQLAYITKELHDDLADKVSYMQLNLSYQGLPNSYWGISIGEIHSNKNHYQEMKLEYEWNYNEQWRNNEENRLYTPDEMNEMLNSGELHYIEEFHEFETSIYKDNFTYLKNDFEIKLQDNKIIMQDNQIIVNSTFVSAIGEDVCQSKINEGLKVKIFKDNNGNDVVAEFTIVGVIGDSGRDFIVSEKSYEIFENLLSGYSFMVSKFNGTDADKDLMKRLETYDNDGVKYSIQNDSTPMLDMLEEILIMMTSVFVWVALGFAIFASLMLMNFISTSITYKKREIGVLRALGARGSDIFGIFFNESMVIALINFALASIATIVGCMLINSSILASIPVDIVLLNVSIRQVLLILGISVGAAFIASFIPTFKISRKKPIDAINNR